MVTDTTLSAGKELSITRVLNAPIELVWKVWTDPEHIKNWWGPNGFTNTIFEMDVKPGGNWEFIMHGPDGKEYKNRSIFKEIIKHKRIVYEHVTGPKFQTTVDFTPQGKKTLLEWRMVFDTAEERDKTVKTFKADVGLKENIFKLEEYLRNVSPGDLPVTLERIFNAPVEKVWNAITDINQMRQWYFPQLENFQPEPGFKTQFNVHHEGKDFMHIWKVKEVVPMKKISLEWKYEGYPGNSLVSFELFSEGNKTRLILTHEGIETFKPEKYPELGKNNFMEGWTAFMDKELKEFLEN